MTMTEWLESSTLILKSIIISITRMSQIALMHSVQRAIASDPLEKKKDRDLESRNLDVNILKIHTKRRSEERREREANEARILRRRILARLIEQFMSRGFE